ncbi:hypothetical protein [Caulobacter sp. CCG-8]|uniref:hypothetical protein n=1 Tax=Caulobacter sp. CCG-8 TaxID=3127958 RepID=UPI00307F27F9
MLTPHGYTFSVDARGQKWRGTWEEDGKDVCVTSAFGSKRAPKGGKQPAEVAAQALRQLVDEWAARQ